MYLRMKEYFLYHKEMEYIKDQAAKVLLKTSTSSDKVLSISIDI